MQYGAVQYGTSSVFADFTDQPNLTSLNLFPLKLFLGEVPELLHELIVVSKSTSLASDTDRLIVLPTNDILRSSGPERILYALFNPTQWLQAMSWNFVSIFK